MTISGWGRLSFLGFFPNILQTVDLIGLTNEDCQSRNNIYAQDIGPEMICAEGVEKGPCNGDSGGNSDLFIIWNYAIGLNDLLDGGTKKKM